MRHREAFLKLLCTTALFCVSGLAGQHAWAATIFSDSESRIVIARFTPEHLIESGSREICYPIDPMVDGVVKRGAKWSYRHNDEVILRFRNGTESRQIARVINRSHAEELCILKASGRSYIYFLYHRQPIHGSPVDEHCTTFDPTTTLASQGSKAKWRVLHGGIKPKVLMFYGKDKRGARNAVQIIRKYGFTNICYGLQKQAQVVYLRR